MLRGTSPLFLTLRRQLSQSPLPPHHPRVGQLSRNKLDSCLGTSRRLDSGRVRDQKQEKASAAGASMHTQNHGKNRPHKRSSCFSSGVFLRGGLSVLQLLQALQGFRTSPDKATQLDASLQGGAGAQFS